MTIPIKETTSIKLDVEIKAKAKELYDAVKGTLSKVRNLLPFSPAKEGPLSDLHKTGLRFVETIAEGIKEDSLTAKASSIMKKVKDFFWTPVQIRTSVQPVKFILSRLPEVNLPPLIQKVKTATALNLFPALLTTGLAQPSFPVPYQKPLSISHISTHNSPAIHHHNEIHIHITVNGKANREDAIEIVKIVRAEMEKYQREQLRKEMRTGYGVGTHHPS
jgi:hypothetical protein